MLPDGTSIRLAAGSHSSPGTGVCVVELASLIAGEEFSDRPRCVCPVIAAFLRGWNDRAGHAERQRLTPYAAAIVGTRGDRGVTRARREICFAWIGVDPRHGAVRRLSRRIAIWTRIVALCGVGAIARPDEAVGDYAARLAFEEADTQRGLGLLEALLTVDRSPTPGEWSANGGIASPQSGDGNRPPATGDGNHSPASAKGHRSPASGGEGGLGSALDGAPDPPADEPHRPQPAAR